MKGRLIGLGLSQSITHTSLPFLAYKKQLQIKQEKIIFFETKKWEILDQ